MKPMIALRSLLFSIAFFGSLAIYLAWMWIGAFISHAAIQKFVRMWSAMGLLTAKWTLGLTYEVRGIENLPEGAVVLASKHQSAWETVVFYVLTQDPCYIMKQELMTIPVWGWYARRVGAIGVDRSGGGAALKKMVKDTLAALDNNRQVIIFPEGTRTAPGRSRPYQPGIAAIYRGATAPVVPVALNSGLFWRRGHFEKRSGVVTVEFLPAIPPGLPRGEFLDRLQGDVDKASNRLVEEARARFPHLPAAEDNTPA